MVVDIINARTPVWVPEALMLPLMTGCNVQSQRDLFVMDSDKESFHTKDEGEGCGLSRLMGGSMVVIKDRDSL